MRLPTFRISGSGLAAAVGGGLATVLLAMITLQHPPTSVALGFVAPLPLMIAAIGFGWIAGVLAVLVGAVFIGAFDLKLGALAVSSHLGTAALDVAVFLVALGLPALILAGIASRSYDVIVRPAEAMHRLRPEEQRLGVLVLVAALFAVLSVGLVFGVAIAISGGFDAFNAKMVAAVEKVWQTVGETRPLPAGLDVHAFARQLTWALAPMMAAILVVFYMLNLWLAARTAQTSGLLRGAWTDIPRYLRLPRPTAILLAVSLGLGFVAGPVGFVARIVAAAVLAALALQGLAVVHEMTRGRGVRTPLLAIVYLSLVVLFPWPLVLWGFLGLLDLAFSFRDRHQPTVVRTRPPGKAPPPSGGGGTGPWDPKP